MKNQMFCTPILIALLHVTRASHAIEEVDLVAVVCYARLVNDWPKFATERPCVASYLFIRSFIHLIR